MAIDDELISKLLDKHDKIAEDIGEIKILQAKQEENIRHHIYRTELNEHNLELLRDQVKPIEQHVKYLHGALKFLGGLSVVATFIVSVLKIYEILK